MNPSMRGIWIVAAKNQESETAEFLRRAVDVALKLLI
jgi:hypothetical protein